MLSQVSQQMVASKFFKTLTISAVIIAGLVIGLETSSQVMSRFGGLLAWVDRLVMLVFIFEILVKWAAYRFNIWHFFRDPWNFFDFAVIVLCLLPIGGSYVAVLRLIRTLRLLRLLTILPKLQLIVGALLKSIPSIGYVGLLLGLHFYIYAVLGVFLFGGNDPLHFATLGKSMLTLFQVLTLEGWADIMRTQIYGCQVFGYDAFPQLCTASQPSPWIASIYFVSFIIVGTMIILNLFIGVIMNGMAEIQIENENSKEPDLNQAGVERLDEAIRALQAAREAIVMQNKARGEIS